MSGNANPADSFVSCECVTGLDTLPVEPSAETRREQQAASICLAYQPADADIFCGCNRPALLWQGNCTDSRAFCLECFVSANKP